MRLTGMDRYVREKTHGFEERAINEPMDSIADVSWYDASRDITDALGYGIGEHRQKEMEKYLNNEVLFNEEMHGPVVEIELTWVQLLWIIGWSEAKNFSDILRFEWNGVSDSDLTDIYYDGYGYDDDTADEIDRIMNKYLTKLLEDEDKIVHQVKKIRTLLEILKNLNCKILLKLST